MRLLPQDESDTKQEVKVITLNATGDFSRLSEELKSMLGLVDDSVLDKYGELGVAALSAVTPVDTGVTAQSWYYKIKRDSKGASIQFCNSNINDGVPIAIILQYGHGTRNGGWVEGKDYINPALTAVLNNLLHDLTREVRR